MSMNHNIICVSGWAADRNLILGSTPKNQFLKKVEEGGEVFEGISKHDKDLVVDAIGDTCVVITIILLQTGNSPELYLSNSRPELPVQFNSFEEAVNTHEVKDAAMVFGMHQGELARALAKEQDPVPSIVAVVQSLKMLAGLMCLDFGECYRIAYNEIKDRKGKMVDGVFVKEEV